MLNYFSSLKNYHRNAIARSFKDLKTQPIASAMTILVIALSLALPAIFAVLTHNLQQLSSPWQQQGHLNLYLKMDVVESDAKALLTNIRNDANIATAILVTPSEGLRLLSQQGLETTLQSLPENPLPFRIDITPKATTNPAQTLSTLYLQFYKNPRVELAKQDGDWVNRIDTLVQFCKAVTTFLLVFLAAAILCIIGNTLRLAMQSAHEEIQILQLIGATKAYILRPFLYLSFWYGLFGACIAVLFVETSVFCLSFIIKPVTNAFNITYSPTGMSIRQILLLFAFAVILSGVGTRLAVKKQLNYKIS